MKTFKLIGKVTISVYTNVEAETLKEAMIIAHDRDLMFIPAGLGEDSEQEWVVDELDGTVKDIHLENQ